MPPSPERISPNWTQTDYETSTAMSPPKPPKGFEDGVNFDSQLQDEKEEIEGGNPPITAKIKPPRINLNLEADTIRNKAEADQIQGREEKIPPEKIPPTEPSKSPIYNTRKHPNYSQPQSTQNLGGDALMGQHKNLKNGQLKLTDCGVTQDRKTVIGSFGQLTEGVIGKTCPKQIDPGKRK